MMRETALGYAIYSKFAYEDVIPTISHTVHFIEDKKTDTQCYVLCNEHEQVVVFRGTEASGIKTDIRKVKDIITDLDVRFDHGTHKGFKDAYDSIAERLTNILEPEKFTVFTGHSLGGALAVVAGGRHESQLKSIVTFGAPRVFDKKTAEAFEMFHRNAVTRYENYFDPIPKVPLEKMGYEHVGDGVTLSNWYSSWLPFFFGAGAEKFGLNTLSNAHSIDTYIKNLS